MASFLVKLGGTNLVTNAPDRVIWKHNKDGRFTIVLTRKAYKLGLEATIITGRVFGED